MGVSVILMEGVMYPCLLFYSMVSQSAPLLLTIFVASELDPLFKNVFATGKKKYKLG